MNQNQQIMSAMSDHLIRIYPWPEYKIEGYFGFAYLTIIWRDKEEKWMFSWDTNTEEVVKTQKS